MDVPLREHVDRMLAEMNHRYEDRFAANDRALQTAEQALREYKAGSNEWRDALKDANNRMATRLELDKVDIEVRELQRAKANLDGRIAVLSAGISGAVSLLAWAIARLME